MSKTACGHDDNGIPRELLVEPSGRQRTSSESARRGEAVDLSSADWTPSTGFGAATRGLLLDQDGDVKLDFVDGGTVTCPLQKGFNPIEASKIYQTGTDAGLVIVALA